MTDSHGFFANPKEAEVRSRLSRDGALYTSDISCSHWLQYTWLLSSRRNPNVPAPLAILQFHPVLCSSRLHGHPFT